MSFFTKTAQLVSGAAVAATLFTATAQAETVLRGASMFDEEHALPKHCVNSRNWSARSTTAM